MSCSGVIELWLALAIGIASSFGARLDISMSLQLQTNKQPLSGHHKVNRFSYLEKKHSFYIEKDKLVIFDIFYDFQGIKDNLHDTSFFHYDKCK